MENPTEYRGYPIEYVVNDVAPDTQTAIVKIPGHGGVTTSERIFRTREDWHKDIKWKVDQLLDDPKRIPESDPFTLMLSDP